MPSSDNVGGQLPSPGQFVLTNVIPLVVAAALWGFHLTIVSFTSYRLRKRWTSSPARRLMLYAITVMFILSTISFAMRVYGQLFHWLVYLFLLDESSSLQDILAAHQHSLNIVLFVQELLFEVEFLIGDAIVVWRTYMLYQDNLRVMLVPAVLWCSALVMCISECAYAASQDGLKTYNTAAGTHSIGSYLQLAAYSLSLLVNLAITILISLKAWRHRRIIRKYFDHSAVGDKVQGTFAVLVESGLFYSIGWLWPVSIIPRKLDGNTWLVWWNIIAYCGSIFVGLYPTVVIAIVELKRSAWDVVDASLQTREQERDGEIPISFEAANIQCQKSDP